MKKNNFSIKSILVVLCLTFVITGTSVRKSEASFIDLPAEGGTLVGTILNYMGQIANHLKDYAQYAQTAVQAYQTTQGVVQQVKSALLGETAQNLTATQIQNLGVTVLNLSAGDHGTSTNIFTKGNSVVTDLGNYLDQVGANEIKKSLLDLQDTGNLTQYSSDIKKAVTDFTKNIANTKAGQIVTFTLPYIARGEICNSSDLKNIITNGEPANYILPKAAVANVDINKICQDSGSTMSPTDQAIFVGLAKAGYGGDKTAQALADPANSKTGVVASALNVIKNKVADVTSNAKSEVTATDLYTGQKQCFGKDGKPVDFEPGSKDLDNQICYTSYTDPLQSGAAIKDNIASAVLAPYISMLSNASAANKSGDCGVNVDKLKTEKEGYGSDFTKQKVTDIGNTYDSCLAMVGNAISGIISGFGLGKKQASNALTDPNSPYARLYSNISSIASVQVAQGALSDQTVQQQKDYEYGNDDYSVDDLKNTISTYETIREFNVERLNKELFTYAFVNLAIETGWGGVPEADNGKYVSCSFWRCKTKTNTKLRDSQLEIQNNYKESLTGLAQAKVSLNISIRDLIREMAKNNYKNQQLNALYSKFKNLPPDTLVASSSQMDELKKALEGVLTLKDYTNLEAAWQYVPVIMDTFNSPLSPNIPMDSLDETEASQEAARRSEVLIVPTDEQYGPYTDQNTLYLRARANKILLNILDKESNLDGGDFPDGTSADTKTLLGRYGITGVGDLNNGNLPLIGNKGVINILDPDETLAWGENDFCNHLGIANTICSDLTEPNSISSTDLAKGQLDTILNSTADTAKICKNDPVTYVAQVCATTTDADVKTLCQNQDSMVTTFKNICGITSNSSATNTAQ